MVFTCGCSNHPSRINKAVQVSLLMKSASPSSSTTFFPPPSNVVMVEGEAGRNYLFLSPGSELRYGHASSRQFSTDKLILPFNYTNVIKKPPCSTSTSGGSNLRIPSSNPYYLILLYYRTYDAEGSFVATVIKRKIPRVG